MKKVLILACSAILFATSCLPGGGSPGSSSTDYTGYLTVSDIETEEVTFSNDNAKVTVAIPNMLEPKFAITFNNMKFDDAMPVKLDIKIEGVPFTTTVSEDETSLNYLFEAKDVIPTVGGIPYNNYKIDNIKGCIGRPVTIEFSMLSKGKTVHFSTIKE